MKVGLIYRSVPPESQPAGTAKTPSPRGTAALLVAAVVVLAAFVLIVPYVPAAIKQGSDIFSQLAGTVPGNTQTGTVGQTTSSSSQNANCSSVVSNHTPSAPDISGGSANVAFPSDYCAIAEYAIGLINQDRAANGSAPVALDFNLAAQQHADSMLYYNYFSHYDTQGYKPYMRYSLLGGLGADYENVAYIFNSPPHFTTTADVEDGVKLLESSMIHNDTACCNNGHRDNIHNALHNKVSIGVAYDGTTVYFDEEFENLYINLQFSFSSSSASTPYYVTMKGMPTQLFPTPNSIYIAYDKTPAPESKSQLDNGPHEYGPGTLVGGVLPRSGILGGCGQFEMGTTVCADTWTFTSNNVDVEFSLRDFVNSNGKGVYTVYIITGSNTNSALTTISVFVS